MRMITLAAFAVLTLAAAPGFAADANYNFTSASGNNNDGQANCHSATLLSGCSASTTTSSVSYTAVVEAPLPLAGSGAFGAALMACAGLAALRLRRRDA